MTLPASVQLTETQVAVLEAVLEEHYGSPDSMPDHIHDFFRRCVGNTTVRMGPKVSRDLHDILSAMDNPFGGNDQLCRSFDTLEARVKKVFLQHDLGVR